MVAKVTMMPKFIFKWRMGRIASKLETGCSTMASSFRTVMAAKLGTVGEYVYLWDKLVRTGWFGPSCGADG